MDKYFMPFCLAHNAQCSGNVSLLHSKSSFIARRQRKNNCWELCRHLETVDSTLFKKGKFQ